MDATDLSPWHVTWPVPVASPWHPGIRGILSPWHPEDLKELVDTPLDEEVSCLDIDEVVRVSIGDRDVRKYLSERYGIADSIKVQELEKEKRNEIIVSCLEIGTGLRQLSRLTGVTYGVINKLNKCR